MKKIVELKSERQIETVQAYCQEILDNDLKLHIVEIKPYVKEKTLSQLGGLFGVWFKYLSEQTGYELTELHRIYKEKFLEDIYLESPANDIQKMWADGVLLWNQIFSNHPTVNNKQKLIEHKERISLSWANVKQMREYMNLIDRYCIDNGISLPILEKYKDIYKR